MDTGRKKHLSESTIAEEDDIPEYTKCVGVRHIQIVLLFFCLAVAYVMRVNMSLAIVAMTSKDSSDFPTYSWSITTKSTILSSFFWGYLIMNLPAAILGHKYNNKLLLGVTFFIDSLLAVTIPFICDWGGATAVIVVRVLQGISQGFMMPMIHGLLSRWTPPEERGRAASYILGGLNFGTMVTLLTSGYLSEGGWGWPSIFYISGALGFGWSVLWFLLGANSPTTHPFISDAEKKFIVKSLNHTSEHGSEIPIPWKCILTSPCVWATVIAHWGHNWGLWTILTEIPTYFNSALGFDIDDLGFLTAAPFLIVWLIAFPLSNISDYLIVKNITPLTFSRKFWNSVAHWGGAACLLGLAFVGKNQTITITLYAIMIALSCCVYLGFNVNHLDLSPNFARILMGLTNGSANVTSILGPLFVGLVVHDEADPAQWRIVFIFASAFFFVGNLIFITLGSAELQPWNDGDPKRKGNYNSSHNVEEGKK